MAGGVQSKRLATAAVVGEVGMLRIDAKLRTDEFRLRTDEAGDPGGCNGVPPGVRRGDAAVRTLSCPAWLGGGRTTNLARWGDPALEDPEFVKLSRGR